MKPEDRFLFMAARQYLQPVHVHAMEVISENLRFNWDLVFSIAEHNAIAPLVYRHVSSLPSLAERVPKTLLNRYRVFALRNSFYKKVRASQLSQILHYFNQHQIQVILFKSVAQDLLVLEIPWVTVSIDIDLILRPKRQMLTEELRNEIVNTFHHKRVEFDYFEHHDMNINGMLPIDFEAVWKDARQIDCDGEPGFVLSPEDHLLAICINSCRKRYFRLKSLFDIHETVLKFPELDWKKFCDRCRRFCCGNIVFASLLVAMRTLGTPVPTQVMQQLGVSTVRSVLIHLGVRVLLKFWSLSEIHDDIRFLKRRIDPALILTYLTYSPAQILHKILEIRAAQKQPLTES